MNTKYTPGPWRTIGYQSVQDARGMEIAWCTVSAQFGKEPAEILTPEAEANACLISAAPDLLEALKAIVGKGIAGIPERFDDLTTMQMDVLVKAIWDGRAAIAKATGTTNL